MKTRKIPVGKPTHAGAPLGPCREWTEITMDVTELAALLGMPKGTRLISIGSNAMTGVKITVEEPGGLVLRRLLLTWAAEMAARAIHPVVVSYAALYHDDGDDEADSGNPEYDRRSTIAGQFEAAANRDHDTLEVIARRRMGFTL